MVAAMVVLDVLTCRVVAASYVASKGGVYCIGWIAGNGHLSRAFREPVCCVCVMYIHGGQSCWT